MGRFRIYWEISRDKNFRIYWEISRDWGEIQDLLGDPGMWR